MKPMVRLEIGVTRMQVRVPRIHIGDNLAQIKAMRLANVQTLAPNVWRPKQYTCCAWAGGTTAEFEELLAESVVRVHFS